MAADDLDAPLGKTTETQTTSEAAGHAAADRCRLARPVGRRRSARGPCWPTIPTAASRSRSSRPGMHSTANAEGSQRRGCSRATPAKRSCRRRPRRRLPPPIKRRPAARSSPSPTARAARAQQVVVPPRPGDKLAEESAADPKLLEDSRHGQIPKVALRRHGAPRWLMPSRSIPADQVGRSPRSRSWSAGSASARSVTEDALTKLPGRGDARFRALRRRPRQSRRPRPRDATTKCCCRRRWSRSIIPTTIPARRRC